MRWPRRSRLATPALFLVAVAVPYSALTIPGVFAGPFNSAGTLQLLALCLVFGGVAQSFDLLFGRSGLLSFGHALYFACGVYGTTILVTKAGWSLWPAAAVSVLSAAVLAEMVGSVAVRTQGIAFAMVTLAFAQVGVIAVGRNPGGVTGGSDGLSLDASRLPSPLVGVDNTVNLYWLALAFAVATTFVSWRLAASVGGRALAAIRDNELRAGVLGLDARRHKLTAFVLGGLLAATGGVVYALTVGGASPHTASSDQSLALLIMVVLGGPATRWGALAGGIGYTLLDERLAALGTSSTISGLPGWLSRPLSQPLLLLGVAFMVLVRYAPRGLAGRTH